MLRCWTGRMRTPKLGIHQNRLCCLCQEVAIKCVRVIYVHCCDCPERRKDMLFPRFSSTSLVKTYFIAQKIYVAFFFFFLCLEDFFLLEHFWCLLFSSLRSSVANRVTDEVGLRADSTLFSCSFTFHIISLFLHSFWVPNLNSGQFSSNRITHLFSRDQYRKEAVCAVWLSSLIISTVSIKPFIFYSSL